MQHSIESTPLNHRSVEASLINCQVKSPARTSQAGEYTSYSEDFLQVIASSID